MSISENKPNLYRTSDDIYPLIQVLIDSFFTEIESKAGIKELRLLEKIKNIELSISPQLMNILESPLDKIHFKDLINVMIIPLVLDQIGAAVENGFLSEEEGELMSILLLAN